jgi:hypothetical protein
MRMMNVYIWHTRDEIPEDHTDIVYVDESLDVWNENNYYADFYDDTSGNRGWTSFVYNREVLYWAYKKELLPE